MSTQKRHLKKFSSAALPLLRLIATRMQLPQLLSRFIPSHGNQTIPTVDTLLLLIYNIAMGKYPLYQLEQWVSTIDRTSIGLSQEYEGSFTDDRFGRALDKLYEADRACLLTELVIIYVKEFGLNLDQLHNDSTSVKAFGDIAGVTTSGLEMKNGHSKDHRDDLKQLIFTLSITADGAVPIHHRCYSGNRTDDTTHIDSWKILRQIKGSADFLYVADSKACTDEQLHYICQHGGTVITVIADTWGEVMMFKQQLLKTKKQKKVIWRRIKPGTSDEKEYFSVFSGTYRSEKRGYAIHWIYSSEKRNRDRATRESALVKAEHDLTQLNATLNTRQYKDEDAIKQAVDAILQEHGAEELITYAVKSTTRHKRQQKGKGRPSKNTKYTVSSQIEFGLSWGRNRQIIAQVSRIDGIFPILCTDPTLLPINALKAYKYQPRLEKRFSQLKSTLHIAPLLFKSIERVEANMFAFFIAIVLQSLLEREVRKNMKQNELEAVYIYPEDRQCENPTAAVIFNRFESIARYEIWQKDECVEHFFDQFDENQLLILKLLNLSEHAYWFP